MKTPEYLIDGWIESADARDVLELLDELFVGDLIGLLRVTGQTVNLGTHTGQVDLMSTACMIAAMLRARVDLEHGERLRAGLAEAEAEESEQARRSTIGAVATL